MNEQNITNIIEYLDQNPDQTTESLVTSLLNEGYPVEDVKAALDRLGISPVVIPGYKETVVYSNSGGRLKGKWIPILILLFVGIILISSIIFAIWFFARTTPTV